LDARSQDIYHQNYRHDNESDTDDDMSQDSNSSDEDDFKSRIGNISTRTSKEGKVKIKVDEEKEDTEYAEEMDPFEKEMETEMANRLLQAEHDVLKGDSEEVIDDMIPDENVQSGSESQNKSAISIDDKDKYDDIYFDSDDETDGKESKKEKQKFQTDDELLYDPNLDDEDQRWMDDLRRTYHTPGASSGLKKNANNGVKPLPNSDAVLNCPACFVVVCLDCQRHDIYKTQYRAMFVMNCSVVSDEVMKVPVKTKKKANKKNKVITHPHDEFHPVRCDQCKTEIAMYDQDEIYHFFNVVASHT